MRFRSFSARRITLLMLVIVTCVCGDGLGDEFLISDRATNQVLRYGANDGSFLGAFIDSNMETNGGLFQPAAMTYGYDNDLFVTSIDLNTGDGQVLRYDGQTGSFEGIYASGIIVPAGIHFHEPSQTILVGSLGTGLGNSNQMYRFDESGASVETISSGPVTGRTGMVSQSDGTLLVSGFAEEPFFNGSILEYGYDPNSDSFSYNGVFAASQELAGANGLTLDENGDLLAASLFGQSVIKYDVESDEVIGAAIVGQTAYPSGLLVDTDGSLLVTSLGNNNPMDQIYPELFPGAVFRFDTSTGTMIGQGPFIVGQGDEFLPTAILRRLSNESLAGDFDADGALTAADIDALSAAVRQGTNPAGYDLTNDGIVDSADRIRWVDIKNTYFGDANLDNEFNSEDMIIVFQAGQYEDDVAANSTWVSGDWNGDSEFDTSDMVAAFVSGGYELGPRVQVAAVPEPSTTVLLYGFALFALSFRKPSWRC